MQKQPDQKPNHSAAGIAVKILLMVLFLPMVIPGFLIGWSMGVQSWMERLGYAKPTYSEYTITCSVSDDVENDEKKPCASIPEYYGHIPVQDCRQQDLIIDGGDGPRKGKGRWSVCWGIDCRETLESSLTPPRENSIISDILAFSVALLLFILFIVLPTVLTIRLFLAIFSAKIRKGIKARPFLHILGAIFSTLLIFPFLYIERIQIPADAEVTHHFYKNQSKFLKLVEMLSEDQQIHYISPSLVLRCGPLEVERYRQYTDLVNQTALLGLRSHWDRAREIAFLRKDCYANANFIKGYVFMNSEPHHTVASLDDGFKELPAGSRLYKKIEKNWYIYLEHQSDG